MYVYMSSDIPHLENLSLYLVISSFNMLYFIQSPCAERSQGETRADRMTDR